MVGCVDCDLDNTVFQLCQPEMRVGGTDCNL